MKKRVLLGFLFVGMLTVTSVLADDVVDFATDPNLATEWTSSIYYDSDGDGCPLITAAWNDVNQNLDLVSARESGVRQLFRNGTTRPDTDGATVTFSNLDYLATSSSWNSIGLLLSSQQTLDLFDDVPVYSLIFQVDVAADGVTPTYFYKVNGSANQQLYRRDIATLPSTMKLDIRRDNSEYVFLVNDEEIFHDTTYASTSLPYYSMFWGSGPESTLTVQADDFGIVDPLPPVTPVSPGVIDFATDPNLLNEWRVAPYYDGEGDGCPHTTAAWNENNQNVDLVSTGENGINMLYKKNTIRNDSEGITATFSNVDITPNGGSVWGVVGMLLSSQQTLDLFDIVPAYAICLQGDIGSDGEASYYYKINSAANQQLFRYDIDTLPETIKFDIVQDDSEYVFLVNDEEIFRDTTYASESLSNFSTYWGGGDSSGGAICELSAQVDDFGTFIYSPNLAGDANGDGKVDGSDVTILAGNWQKGVSDGLTAIWEEGDFNGDGKVDGSDVTILAGNWQAGVETAASAVPEPSTLVMLILMAGGLMIGRRR